jgi:hypothetical protein
MLTQIQIQELIKRITELEKKVCVLETKVTELTSIEDDLFNDLENLELG